MNQRDPFLKSVPKKVTFTDNVHTESLTKTLVTLSTFNNKKRNIKISTNLSKCTRSRTTFNVLAYNSLGTSAIVP